MTRLIVATLLLLSTMNTHLNMLQALHSPQPQERQRSRKLEQELPCYDSPTGWHDGDGEAFNCQWYGDPLGDDDSVYDDQTNSTRCEEFGNSFQDENNITASMACCACGGGVRSNFMPSASPSESTKPSSSVFQYCQDYTDWFYYTDIYGCEYFAEYPDDDDSIDLGDDVTSRCDTLYGSALNQNGISANQACCDCGGGVYNERAPSVAPSTSHEPTAEPSTYPTTQLFKTGCEDVEGWHDSLGEDFGCNWYDAPVAGSAFYDDEDTRCDLYGDSYENFGHTAKTACCGCGGGIWSSQTPSVTPSTTPFGMPSLRVSKSKGKGSKGGNKSSKSAGGDGKKSSTPSKAKSYRTDSSKGKSNKSKSGKNKTSATQITTSSSSALSSIKSGKIKGKSPNGGKKSSKSAVENGEKSSKPSKAKSGSTYSNKSKLSKSKSGRSTTGEFTPKGSHSKS